MTNRIETTATITMCKTAATAKGKKIVVISLDLPGQSDDEGILSRMVNVTGLKLTLFDPQIDGYKKMMASRPEGIQAPLPAPVFSGPSDTTLPSPEEGLSDEERAANEAEADRIRAEAEVEQELAGYPVQRDPIPGVGQSIHIPDTHDFKHSYIGTPIASTQGSQGHHDDGSGEDDSNLPPPSSLDDAAGASSVAPRRSRAGSKVIRLSGRRTS